MGVVTWKTVAWGLFMTWMPVACGGGVLGNPGTGMNMWKTVTCGGDGVGNPGMGVKKWKPVACG